jgi:hypothetical protein
MVQNSSHAVMAQRHEAADSLDDFPTPPWATRALIEKVLGKSDFSNQSCWEPACNRGFMSRVLEEYFRTVKSTDISDYGYGNQMDFLGTYEKPKKIDWVITNPPFRLSEDFIFKSFEVAKTGVAILARTVFLESVGRYDRLFSKTPPTCFAQFSERVPMVKGRLDKKASTATGYAWFVWEFEKIGNSTVFWIPPCRKFFEKVEDYDIPEKSSKQKEQGLLF